MRLSPTVLLMSCKALLVGKSARSLGLVAGSFIFASALGNGSAQGAELIAASFHGEIQTIDTDSGAVLNEFYMSTDSGTGPNGVAFRGRDTMFITVSIGFGGYKVYQFGNAGGQNWVEGLKFYQGRWDNPLFSSPSAITQAGSSGIMYAVGQSSHDLWAFSGTRVDNNGDVFLAGNQVLKLNTGASTMWFPSEIEASPLDGRLAIGAGQKLRIFSGVAAERDIALAANIDGLAFDALGREVTKDSGEKEIHSLVYVLMTKSDQARIDRFDAVTGEPWGADPANRSNPIFIAPGTGGLAHYSSALEIDHITGDIYVGAANSFRTDFWGLPLNCISRFDKDGKPKGLGNNATNAVLTTAFNSGDLSLALRPRYDVKTFTTTGSYDFNLTPGSVGFGLAGLNFVAANGAGGTTVNVLPSANAEPNIKVGGEGSAGIQINIKDGNQLTVNNLAVGENGTMEVGANSSVTVKSMAEILKGARVRLVGSLIKVIALLLDIDFGAELSGTGSIEAEQIGVIIRGLLSPGQSPGKLNIKGNLWLASESELKIELAGTEQGVGYDWLEVQNTATGSVGLHGKLMAHLLNGFQPQATQEFNIITSEGTVLLNFQNAVGGRVITADGKGTFLVKLAADNKTVQLTDYQRFTGAPYQAWAQNTFTASENGNATISGPAADPDGDGAVNLVEFAFNTNPKVATAEKNFGASLSTSGTVALEFTRRKGGAGTSLSYEVDEVRFELKETTDLQTWTGVSGNVTSEVQPNSDGITENVKLRLEASPAARFFNLTVGPK
jgi:hypothetical protein